MKKYVGTKGEQLVDCILGFNDMQYEREFSFKNSKGTYQRMDFYVEYQGNKYCIEYNGEQHYRKKMNWDFNKQVELDKLKMEYCKDNDIEFIVIKYTKDTLDKVFIELSKYFNIDKPDDFEIFKESIKYPCQIRAIKIDSGEVTKGTYSKILFDLSNIKDSNLHKCLQGELDKTMGYRFELLDNELESKRLNRIKEREKYRKQVIKSKKFKRTPIYAKDINTGNEKYFKSIKECEDYYGISGVIVVLNDKTGKRKTLGNKIFRHKNGEYKYSIQNIVDTKQEKYVIATNIKDGSTIEGHLSEVARKIGSEPTNLCKVLKGKAKTCKGYKAKYVI